MCIRFNVSWFIRTMATTLSKHVGSALVGKRKLLLHIQIHSCSTHFTKELLKLRSLEIHIVRKALFEKETGFALSFLYLLVQLIIVQFCKFHVYLLVQLCTDLNVIPVNGDIRELILSYKVKT